MNINIRKFFLENIGVRQTIFKNTFWLVFAEITSRILGLALIIYVARVLGAVEYGKFMFAFSFVSVIVLFSDLGVIDVATREFSRNKEKEKEFSSLLTLNIILSVGTLLLMILGSFFITSDLVIQKMIWILSFFILISSFFGIFYAFLRSRQKMEYEAGIKIAQNIIMAGVVFFIIFYFPSAINLSYGYLLSNVVSLPFLLLLFHFYFIHLKLSWNKNIFSILKISWPLSLGFTTSWIYMSISSILLGYFGLIAENGWYSAASKIALATVVPADLIIRSFYPALSNFFLHSKEKLQRSWDHLMELMIFLTIPTVTGGIVLAPKIIHFFYGSNFNPSILAFQLLMYLIGISLLGYPFSLILVISDEQKKNFFLIIAGVIMSSILGVILIPMYGFYGMITATIISSLIILFLTIIVAKYFTPISIFNAKFIKTIIMAGFSSFVMFFIINLPIVNNLNIFYSVIIGILTYFMLFFLLHKIYKK